MYRPVECPNRRVLRVECSHLECGRRQASKEGLATNQVESPGVPEAGDTLHGDWPWHVALLKEGVHVCDATLVHQNWVMTTASCFQGYVLKFF